MSGLTRERGAAVIGPLAFHSVLSSLLYWLKYRFDWKFILRRVGAVYEILPELLRQHVVLEDFPPLDGIV